MCATTCESEVKSEESAQPRDMAFRTGVPQSRSRWIFWKFLRDDDKIPELLRSVGVEALAHPMHPMTKQLHQSITLKILDLTILLKIIGTVGSNGPLPPMGFFTHKFLIIWTNCLTTVNCDVSPASLNDSKNKYISSSLSSRPVPPTTA